MVENTLEVTPYDGYAECVKTTFDESCVTVTELMGYFSRSSTPTA